MKAERRRYYRIDDEVSLSYQPIATSDLDARLENFWAGDEAAMRDDLNIQIEQQIADRQKIEQKMPELARCLDMLQQQINSLSAVVNGEQNTQALQLTASSLSAQGIAFFDNQAPAADELVELTLKLLPSGLRLVIIARVVTIETLDQQQSRKFKISMDFEHLHEADREILIKHMHCKQREALSSARDS